MFRLWRTRQLNRDMDYCHPRWSQEKTFLESEMKAVRTRKQGLLSDPWNIFDFLTYASVSTVIITRLASFFSESDLGTKKILNQFSFSINFFVAVLDLVFLMAL